MKLKLNVTLRRALCSAMLSLATWTTTVGTATLVASQLISSQAAAADVSFTGSADESTPSNLSWNEANAFDGSSFAANDNASFTGYTDATLSTGTTVGALNINDGDLTITTSGNALSIGNINGNGSLTLTGNTSLTGDVNMTGDLVIASGTTTFGTGQSHTKNIHASSITIASGARMNIGHAAADWRDTDLNLQGGTLHSNDLGLNSNGGVQFGALNVTGASTFSHAWNGVWAFESLTGTANINFVANNATNEDGILRFKSVNNYNGTINLSGGAGINGSTGDGLEITGMITQSAGNALNVTGNIATTLTDTTFSGSGSISFASARISGSNTQDGGTQTFHALSFASDSSSLNVNAGTLILSGAISGSTGTLRTGAADVQFTTSSTISQAVELGSHSGSAGTDAAPIYTSMNVGAQTVSITSNITDVSGSVGGIRLSGTGTLNLSGNSSFSGGIEVSGTTLNLGHIKAAGSGTIELRDSASLSMNNNAIANTIHYYSGTISGAGAYAGTLHVNEGALALGDISGSVNVAAGASLTLSGLWDFTTGMNNSGTISLLDGISIDLTGVAFSADGGDQFSLTLFGNTDTGILNDSILLSDGSVDLSKFVGLQTSKRTYSYADGILSYTTDAQDLVHSTGDLIWNIGSPFDGGDTFTSGDNVLFKAGNITLGGDLEVGSLVSEGTVNFTSPDPSRTLRTESLVVSGTTTFENIHLEADLITIQDNASLDISNDWGTAIVIAKEGITFTSERAGTGEVTLGANSSLVISDTLAAGAASFNNIKSSETTSSLMLSLSTDGTSIEAVNFDGTLKIKEGQWTSSLSNAASFTASSLLNESILRISDTFGSSASLSTLSGDVGSKLIANFSTDPGNGTNLQLGAGFTGSVEVLSGTLSARNSNLGGASKLILHNNTGLVFNQSNNSHTFTTDVSIIDGASVTIRAWGGTGTRTLSGAITGGAGSTINKTDYGTIAINNLSGFAGNINVGEGILQVGSDISFNQLTIGSGDTFEVGANLTLSTSAVTGSNSFYLRSTNHGYNMIIGAGSTFTDNVQMRLGSGTTNISGTGVYEIKSLITKDSGSGNTLLNIAANTTLKVTGTTVSNEADANASFMLGHWGLGGTTTLTVNGTLDIASGISSKDGTSVMNVESGGTLIMRQGLYANDAGNNAGTQTINIKSGSTLKIGNQTTNTATNVLTANIAGGSTLQAIDAQTNVLNSIKLVGDGSVAVNASADNATVNFNGSIANGTNPETEALYTSGLSFSGSATQTFNLNASNSYSGGTSITGAQVVVGHASALGDGRVTLNSGTLQLNGHSVDNNITAAGGTLSGFGAYAGALNVTGAVAVSDRITGNISVADSGDLTLNGVWDYSAAISNEGNVELAAGLKIDLTSASFIDDSGTHKLTLIDGGTSDVTAWLSAGEVNTSLLEGVITAGRSFTYDNGVLSYTINSKPLTYTGGDDFTWGVGTTFTTGGDFAQGDSVTFSGVTTGTLTESIDTAAIHISDNSIVTLYTSEAKDFILNAGELSLAENAHLYVITYEFEAIDINLATGSVLNVNSIGSATTNLEGTAFLGLMSTLASGNVSLDHVTATSEATMFIATSEEGTVLSLENFHGYLDLRRGSLITDRADLMRLDALELADNTNYSLSERLGNEAIVLSKITGEADSQIFFDLSNTANHGTELTLGTDYLGSLVVKSGKLSAADSNLGGTKQVILQNGAGIVFDKSSTSSSFETAIHIEDGATTTIQSWGSLTESYTRSITQAVTGAADTRFNKTDGGQLHFSDLTGYAGTIDVQAGKVLVNSDASLNKVYISGTSKFEVATGKTVTATGGVDTYYERSTTGTGSIIVGEGASFTDNVYWSLNNANYTVEGGGTYTIDGFLGTASSRNSTTLTIAENTEMIVLNTNIADRADAKPAFMLSNYGKATDATTEVTSTVNVNGTLTLNSGIANQDGIGIIAVGSTGTLILNQGLYGVDDYKQAEQININTVNGSTLKLANQTQAPGVGGAHTDATDITTNIAAGTKIVGIDADTTDANTTVNVLNTLKLSGIGSANISADSGVTEMNFNAAISQVAVADGETAHSTGLAIATLANQTINLNAANSYTGGTTLSGAGTLKAGNASAFGEGNVTVNSGTLNIDGLAITNDVTVNGGTIQGFSAYAGDLTIAGTTTVSDTITGVITITDTGSLTLAGTWDYSSTINVAGTLNVDAAMSLDLSGATFSESAGVYTLDLFNFSGSGSADLSAWDAATASITGYTSREGYGFSYENGVLTYAYIPPADIIIPTEITEDLSGEIDVNIIFEDETGIASLGTGFSQGPDSVISGGGTVAIAGAVTLSNENTYSGTTSVNTGSTLTVGGDKALGSSALEVKTGASVVINDDVALSNNATLNDTAEISTGIFTIGVREDTGQAHISNIADATPKEIAHDTLTRTVFENATVKLMDGGTGYITDTTLTATAVTLGIDSVLTMNNVRQQLGTTITNTNAKLILNNHQISSATLNGLSNNVRFEDLWTVENNLQNMLVYTLDSIDVTDVDITGTLTLDFLLTGSDLDSFNAQISAGGLVAFELSGVKASDLMTDYTNVTVNVYSDTIGGTLLWGGAATGQTNVGTNVALYIPEPSTATLSLLALAGLLARRRRRVS